MASRQAKKRAKRRRHRYEPQVGDYVLVNKRSPAWAGTTGVVVARNLVPPFWAVQLATAADGVTYYDCYAGELRKLTIEEEAAMRLSGG